MRNRFAPSALTAVAALSAASVLSAQTGTPDLGLSIKNYQIISEKRLSGRQEFYVTYRADLVNTGLPRTAITATATSTVAGLKIVPGRGALHFSPVPENSQVPSNDTFTVWIDRDQVKDLSGLRWSFLNPVAKAGENQTVLVGSTVRLNGGSSSNPTGVGLLSYKWAFESKPEGSNAAIANPTNPIFATFVVDVPGEYVVSLLVSNGLGEDTAVVTFSTVNSKPVAKAGPNQTASLGAEVILNGSGSSDVDGDKLSYVWTMVSQPAASKAVINAFRGVIASFKPDVAGQYVVQLVVNDGTADSDPSFATITVGGAANTPPVANAGVNQTVTAGTLVQLTGSGSTDVDGDPLSYRWSILTLPAGSKAQLSNAAIMNPVITPDLPGTYIIQLIVNDGHRDSEPVTVTITAGPASDAAPKANAGPNQTVSHGATVQLNGTGIDPKARPLTYRWYLISMPPGSTAALSDPAIPNPTFVADKAGNYVAQLIVSNGTYSSAPSTVVITTTNTAPVANAGQNKVVPAGTLVTLDGGDSTDADNDALTYSWSLISRPAGSDATLSAAKSKTPTFVADLPGDYVAQLIVNDGITNSTPSTVTVTAVGTKIILTPDTFNLTSTPATLTIKINPAAGPQGAKITFFGYSPNVISVPANVTIPPNATSVDVTINPVGSGGTYLYASSPGYQPGMATVNVTVPSMAVTLAAIGVAVGRSINGSVELGEPAPAGGVAVTLHSSADGGTVSFDPPVVQIGAGETKGSFTAAGVKAGFATVSASGPGYGSAPAVPVLVVANLGNIMMDPQTVVDEESTISIDIRITSPAPAGGVTVNLVSSDPAVAKVSQAVFIPAGALAPVAAAQVTGVAGGKATISGTAQNYTAASQVVVVIPKPAAP